MPTPQLRMVICLAACAAVAGPSQAQDERQQDESARVVGELGRSMDVLCERAAPFGFSGAVLVARGDEVLLARGYGRADRGAGTPNRSDTLFDLASVTKQLTAAAVLLLEQEDVLSTDDPIARWLPDVPESLRDVTVDHLLNHTAGFSRFGASGFGSDLARGVAGYLRAERKARAGERFEYYNGGYALLAAIVEVASGVDYREFMRGRIFGPAGMKSAAFCQDDDLDPDRVAHGYEGAGDIGPASAHTFGWEYRGMGGVLASVQDLYAWDRALASDVVLGEAARQKLFAPGRSGYARGWFVNRTRRGTRRAHHSGTVQGFECELWRYLDEGAVVIVLCNDRGASTPIATHLAGLLFEEKVPFASPPPTVALDAAALRARAGDYDDDGWTRLQISFETDPATGLARLRSRGFVADTAVAQTAEQLWRLPFEQLETIAVMRDVIEGLARRDPEPLAAIMAERIPASWPENMVRRIWPRHRARHGSLESVGVLEVDVLASGAISASLLLEHARSRAVALVVMHQGRLQSLDLAGGELMQERIFLPTDSSGNELVSCKLSGFSIGQLSFTGPDELRLRAHLGLESSFRRQRH